MRFYADLHIHSKYSRATSRNCDLEHLALWARRKGIAVVATGDFTHPAWFDEIREKLIPAEPGLFRLRPEIELEIERRLPSSCAGPTRFLLEVEISTIYKKGEKTRKVHHLIYAPDLETAGRFRDRLGKIGNIASDGRPILGLDSRHLLEITLESGPDAYLIPAHIWTPWFAVLGSKSGFDSIEECYGDLSDHIFAVETGLSSDPPMNWRISGLDRFTLVSNSDAHSPPMLGREACVFDTDLDYYAMRRALETGQGYGGTVEFFPEEGKYHMDGHRACQVRLEPGETRQHEGNCPVCGKPVTVGVMHRVEILADREEPSPPEGAAPFRSLVPLPEVISELRGVGPKSKTVGHEVASLVTRLGPELEILEHLPLEDLGKESDPLVAEAIGRLREGQVFRQGGYDGEYGTIRLFEPGELAARTVVPSLFDLPLGGVSSSGRNAGGTPALPASEPESCGTRPSVMEPSMTEPSGTKSFMAEPSTTEHSTSEHPTSEHSMEEHSTSEHSTSEHSTSEPSTSEHSTSEHSTSEPSGTEPPMAEPSGSEPPMAEHSTSEHSIAEPSGTEHSTTEHSTTKPSTLEASVPTSVLDRLDLDQRAAAETLDGPLLIIAGPGTGKTRTLTHRIAHLVSSGVAAPEACLAITFTRRTAEELRERLTELLDEAGQRLPVHTFHSLGLAILREQRTEIGLHRGFRIAEETERIELARQLFDLTARQATQLLTKFSYARRDRALTTKPAEDANSIPERLSVYESALWQRDLVDFDDLLVLPTRLLAERDDLKEAYRARFGWISIDEYQDVDALQYRLVQLLAPPSANLCAIGDPDQSIYRFRGAEVGFFLSFQQDYPAGRVVHLGRNYRSSRVIVDAAMSAIAPASLVEERQLRAVSEAACEPVVVQETGSDRAEAEFVVHTIERLLGGTSYFSIDSGRVEGGFGSNLSFDDFAVLYRTDAQSGALIDALEQSGIPYQKRSHSRLTSRPEVRALIATLRNSDQSPAPRSDSVLDQLAAEAIRLASEDPEAATEEVAEEPADEPSAERFTAASLRQAVDLVAPLAKRHGNDLAGFLAEIALGAEVDTWDPRAERVSLLTLHAAKGLEFPVVFIVGCEQGLVPLHYSADDPEQVDEERRLFFVGMTRARARLFLSYAKRRAWRGEIRDRQPSPFLSDIEETLLQRRKSEARRTRKKEGPKQLRLL